MPGRLSPRTMAALAAGCAVAAAITAAPEARADDDFGGDSVIFARGAALYRVDPRGRGETEIAQLAGKPTVRGLRSDAGGSVLLADLAGRWAWMPLDGSTRALIDLPCADGPAQLADDGSAVLCRSTRAPAQSVIVELGRGAPRITVVDVPPASARLVGSGGERALMWADTAGVWTAPPGDLRRKTRAALDVPLRGFLASPDGDHAVAVYADQVFSDSRSKQSAEVLMILQLDGQGARRKAIRDGVPIDWSHDGQWLLVQDGGSACIMKASGGQYKCWRGMTAASLSEDGRWALALGNRDGSRQADRKAKAKAKAKTDAKADGKRRGKSHRDRAERGDKDERAVADATPGRPPPRVDLDPRDKPWDHIDEPSDEPESREPPPPADDTGAAAPHGPLALYRLRLEGAFTDRPALLVKVVDGAAVWVPGPP
jgi:hypothetical protein